MREVVDVHCRASARRNLKLFLILAANLHFCSTHLSTCCSWHHVNLWIANKTIKVLQKFPSLSQVSHLCAVLHNEHLPCYTCSKLPAITVINWAGQGPASNHAALSVFYLVHWTVKKLSRMCALKCKSRCCPQPSELEACNESRPQPAGLC